VLLAIDRVSAFSDVEFLDRAGGLSKTSESRRPTTARASSAHTNWICDLSSKQ
jgi:hypothetical protein